MPKQPSDGLSMPKLSFRVPRPPTSFKLVLLLLLFCLLLGIVLDYLSLCCGFYKQLLIKSLQWLFSFTFQFLAFMSESTSFEFRCVYAWILVFFISFHCINWYKSLVFTLTSHGSCMEEDPILVRHRWRNHMNIQRILTTGFFNVTICCITSFIKTLICLLLKNNYDRENPFVTLPSQQRQTTDRETSNWLN